MKYKIVISSLLALSVIFQAAQPLSVFAQEASVDSQKAARKKIPKKPTRIFSAMPSLEPETEQAKKLAEAMQLSVRERLTPITLRKFELKPGKSAPSVSADTKFTINEVAADGSLALGSASVPGGDAFAVFLKQSNGVVAIVETYQRLVGNKKIDLEREAQLQAVGFKVYSLVDRYQVVHWNSLDPKGIPETVAKQPTFVTKSLIPEQLQKVIFPKQKKATGVSVSAAIPPVLIAAITADAVLANDPRTPKDDPFTPDRENYECFSRCELDYKREMEGRVQRNVGPTDPNSPTPVQFTNFYMRILKKRKLNCLEDCLKAPTPTPTRTGLTDEELLQSGLRACHSNEKACLSACELSVCPQVVPIATPTYPPYPAPVDSPSSKPSPIPSYEPDDFPLCEPCRTECEKAGDVCEADLWRRYKPNYGD